MATYFSTADFASSLTGAIRDIFTRPTEFFSQMPKATSYKEATILLILVMALPLMLILLLKSGILAPVFLIVAVSVAIPVTLAAAWLWAWYLSWAVRTFANGSLSIMDAFQLYAYSSIPSLFSWIPLVGLVMGIWGVYLEWKGLTAYAGVSSGKALLIIFVPLIVLVVSLLILGILVGVYLSQSPQPNVERMF